MIVPLHLFDPTIDVIYYLLLLVFMILVLTTFLSPACHYTRIQYPIPLLIFFFYYIVIEIYQHSKIVMLILKINCMTFKLDDVRKLL